MSPQPLMGQPQSSAHGASKGLNDLEITAELPVLDVAAYEAAARARAAAPPESDPDASDSGATSLMAAVVAPASPELPQPEPEASPADEGTGTQLEANMHSLSDTLREVEERLRRKGERLVEMEKSLAHAGAERAGAEQRAQKLAVDLTHARSANAVSEARIAELHRNIEEHKAARQQAGVREQDLEQMLALRDKSIALVQQDLTTSQALAASYFETLQSLEGRRGLFQELSLDLYHQVDDRDARVQALEAQLATANQRAREAETLAGERMVRITSLEAEVSALGAGMTQKDASIREAQQASEALRRNVDALTETVAAREARIAALEAAASQQANLLAERGGEAERIVAERAALLESVDSLETRLAEATAQVRAHDAAARMMQTRYTELESTQATQRKRFEQMESELATVREELEQRSKALEEATAERGDHTARIAAGEARVKELDERNVEQQETVRTLQAEANAAVARVKELESDLRAAEDMINRLEADLRGRSTRLEELEKTNREWRNTVEEARSALTDRDSLIRRLEEETANSQLLLGAIQQRLDASGTHETIPDGDKRLLMRSDGSGDVVHVLGRKTTIGRTPDNDMQIDAKYISRHHAVILAGPAHTIIEDLNSTNGVLVNGRRITRQTLSDGDSVVIGKTVFRFAVRAAGERRGVTT